MCWDAAKLAGLVLEVVERGTSSESESLARMHFSAADSVSISHLVFEFLSSKLIAWDD